MHARRKGERRQQSGAEWSAAQWQWVQQEIVGQVVLPLSASVRLSVRRKEGRKEAAATQTVRGLNRPPPGASAAAAGTASCNEIQKCR